MTDSPLSSPRPAPTLPVACICGHSRGTHPWEKFCGEWGFFACAECACTRYRPDHPAPSDADGGTPPSKELLSAIQQGVDDAKAGRVQDLGSFRIFGNTLPPDAPEALRRLPYDIEPDYKARLDEAKPELESLVQSLASLAVSHPHFGIFHEHVAHVQALLFPDPTTPEETA